LGPAVPAAQGSFVPVLISFLGDEPALEVGCSRLTFSRPAALLGARLTVSCTGNEPRVEQALEGVVASPVLSLSHVRIVRRGCDARYSRCNAEDPFELTRATDHHVARSSADVGYIPGHNN
jgi:hypothetical protein